MATIEEKATLKRKDSSGNLHLMHPATTVGNVIGLQEIIDELRALQRFDTPFASTSTDGVAYSISVPGIDSLVIGYSFVMVPDTTTTSINTTLNVNGLGAKRLRLKGGGYTATTVSPSAANWMAANKPVRVTYDGLWWVADLYQ